MKKIINRFTDFISSILFISSFMSLLIFFGVSMYNKEFLQYIIIYTVSVTFIYFFMCKKVINNVIDTIFQLLSIFVAIISIIVYFVKCIVQSQYNYILLYSCYLIIAYMIFRKIYHLTEEEKNPDIIKANKDLDEYYKQAVAEGFKGSRDEYIQSVLDEYTGSYYIKLADVYGELSKNGYMGTKDDIVIAIINKQHKNDTTED